MEQPRNSNKAGIWVLAVIVVIAAIVYLAWPKSPVPNDQSGSNSATSTWKAFSDAEVSFKYPEKLPTIYIRASDWPPKVQLMSDPFTCLQAGTTTAPAGKTEAISVNGHLYCVTMESEGAAGSTYNQYAYAAEKDGHVAIFTFTTQLPQCVNYDDPKKTECQVERDAFDINSIIDPVIQSLKIK